MVPEINLWNDLLASMLGLQIVVTGGVWLITSKGEIQIHTGVAVKSVQVQAAWTQQFLCREFERSLDLCMWRGSVRVP